jgi:hypothetical protein
MRMLHLYIPNDTKCIKIKGRKSVLVLLNCCSYIINLCGRHNPITTMKIDPQYVLAPFHKLLEECQNNVLMGLRIVEKLDKFPAPTQEELQFFQLSMGGQVTGIANSKTLFKKWVLVNGFEDIHKCFRVTLERLYILKTIDSKIKSGETFKVEEVEAELKVKASNLYFDQLINSVNSLFPEPLEYQRHILSFNNARNCLVHTNGIVTTRHCNNPEKDNLTITGNRFKMFFKRGEEETLAEIGRPGPENAALMLGSEEFQIVFSKDKEIELNLKQFIDVLNTCVFVKADIGEMLRNNCA